MSVNSCFDNIIGFSRKQDLCIPEDWLDIYSVSKSELYVDELPGMPQRFIASLGGNYDIWEKMTNARENAINAFKIDVLAQILKYKEPARGRFKGDIGGKSFSSILSYDQTHGLRMYSDIIGGNYTLRGISLILNVSEVIDFSILDENYDVIYTDLFLSIAGRVTNFNITPLVLPLTGNYYFIYHTSKQPYNNKLTCNCGGFNWCFNLHNPCYAHTRENWTEWSMVAGIHGSNTDYVNWPLSREAHGLILHGDFNCDILGTLCSDHSDWTGNEIDFAIANAIWYKTGEFLATYVMDTEEVSRRTLLGTEQWNANRVYYNERYVAMIDFIADQFETERNECLRCKQPMGYAKRVQIL